MTSESKSLWPDTDTRSFSATEKKHHSGHNLHYPNQESYYELKVGSPVILSALGKQRLKDEVPEVKYTIMSVHRMEGESMYKIRDENGNTHTVQYFDVELNSEKI